MTPAPSCRVESRQEEISYDDSTPHISVPTAILALAAVCAFAGSLLAGPDSRVGGPNPGDPPVLLPGQTPWQLQGVGIDEHLGRTIDLGLTFTAENGDPVKLGDFFNQGRPVILDLVYYKCPMLCTLILNAQTADHARHRVDAGKRLRSGHHQHRPARDLRCRQREEGHLSEHLRPPRARAGIFWRTRTATPKSSPS